MTIILNRMTENWMYFFNLATSQFMDNSISKILPHSIKFTTTHQCRTIITTILEGKLTLRSTSLYWYCGFSTYVFMPLKRRDLKNKLDSHNQTFIIQTLILYLCKYCTLMCVIQNYIIRQNCKNYFKNHSLSDLLR